MHVETLMDRPEIREFARRFGMKRPDHVLSVLGRHLQFGEALASDTGQELLKDIIGMWDEIMPKVVLQTATDLEKMRFAVVNDLLVRWAKRINDLLELRNER